MKNIYFFLLIATSIVCFNPIAVRSQESSSVPTTLTEQAPRDFEAKQVEGNTENDITSSESSDQSQLESTTQNEENIDEVSFPDLLNPHQPESTEQGEEQPREDRQAEESTPTIDETYSQLEQYLDDQQWQQADQATYELMLSIAGSKSEEQGYFDRLEWENFSCEEFQRIDSLWGEASQGQQGFTAQLNIFREVDASSTYFNRIGWQQEGKWLVRWQYSRDEQRASYLPGMQPNFVDPPAGHLPALLQWSGAQDFRLAKAASCLAQ